MKKTLDGRKPVLRSLPPISEACAGFQGFSEGEHRSERIFEMLSIVIQRCRRAVPQPFYAMRDVAKFFGVSLDTVAKVYRRLDREGVLTLVRSSQTVITPRTPRPRFALRGVVCMPLWLPAFLQFLDWRRCIAQLEEELSRYRFVSEPIFYKIGEEVTPGFVERVLKYNPDYILWYCPGEGDATTMHSLSDAGVPLVVIQNSPGNFPGRIYRLSYERALRRGLKEWAESGEIDDIVVPQRGIGTISATTIMRTMLKGCPIPHRFEPFRPEKISLSVYLQRLAPNPRTAIIFDDDLFYARLCGMMPDVMLEFFRRHRVMVMRHTTIPTESMPDVTVDALFFPWKQLVRRIAMDLSKAKGFISAEHAILEADWLPRQPLLEAVQADIGE